jgi:hypothetical protein
MLLDLDPVPGQLNQCGSGSKTLNTAFRFQVLRLFDVFFSEFPTCESFAGTCVSEETFHNCICDYVSVLLYGD